MNSEGSYFERIDRANAEPNLGERANLLMTISDEMEAETFPLLPWGALEAAQENLREAQQAAYASLSPRLSVEGPVLPKKPPERVERAQRRPQTHNAPCLRRGRPPIRARGAGRPAGRRATAGGFRGDPDAEQPRTHSVSAILARAADLVELHRDEADYFRGVAARWRALTAELLHRLEGDPASAEAWAGILEQLTKDER